MRALFIVVAVIFLHGCSLSPFYQGTSAPSTKKQPKQKTGKPYKVMGKWYYPLSSSAGYRERGIASWYGKKFHGRKTSNGETYNMYAMTAAHKTLPLPTQVRVRNLKNNKSIVVRVNDRGPFVHDRIIDLSYAAAVKLGIDKMGVGQVEVESLTAGRRPAQTQQPNVEAKKPIKMYLQVGAYAKHENALSMQARLKAGDIQPIIIQQEQRANDVVYRVRVGPFDSIEQGDAVLNKIHTAHNISDVHIIIE